MPVSVSELRTELTTDPTGLGYAAQIAVGNDAQLAELVNQVRPTITVFRNDVQSWELLASTIKADWDALAAGDKDLYQALIAAGRLDATSSSLRNLITALFPSGSTTRTNLQSIAQRTGSRAEQLWGTSAAVSVGQVSAALREG